MTEMSAEEMADIIIDRLPAHQRNAVLKAMYQGEDVDISPREVPVRRHKPHRFLIGVGILIPAVFLWSLPLFVIGLLLLPTVILSPVGMAMMALAAYPVNQVVTRLGKLD